MRGASGNILALLCIFSLKSLHFYFIVDNIALKFKQGFGVLDRLQIVNKCNTKPSFHNNLLINKQLLH